LLSLGCEPSIAIVSSIPFTHVARS
jgi:hypothetical protein